MRIIIGMTGASGAVFGVEFLRRCTAEKFLILTKWGRHDLKEETGLTEHHLAEYVKRSFSDEDLSGPFASGSNPFDALVILPCSASCGRASAFHDLNGSLLSDSDFLWADHRRGCST